MASKLESPATDALGVRAYPRALRGAAAGLLLVSGASLPFLLCRVLLATDPPMTPQMVLRAFLAFSALPAVAAWLVERALAARVDVDREALEVRVGGQHFTLPLASIVAVEPWRLPLPQAGFSLGLASGGRFALGIGADDPGALLARLAAGGVAAAKTPAEHPSLLYARVKHAAGRLRGARLVAKFPLFGALVAGVLFNAHQHIAYGGTLGQYHLDGALPYARTFLTYWVTTTIYLVLYASVWRVPAEAIAWLAARRGERAAAFARRVAELTCRLAYYGGVPMLLALRFAD
jgi:apolipoprotein N-acyltransferase